MNQLSTASSPAPATAVLPPPAPRLAALCANWHAAIVHQARDAFVAELDRRGVSTQGIAHFDVPGAFEIPLLARRLALTGRFDAITAFGLVVDGGIYRHDFVARAVVDGLMRVQLDTGVPVFSVVLTPHHFHDHEEHQRFYSEHFVVKGREAAAANLQTLALHQQLDRLTQR